MIRALLLVFLLSGCVKTQFVQGCEGIADPVQYTNCKLTGLTK